MKRYQNWIYIALSLYLGLVMCLSSIKKFTTPVPTPTEVITKAQNYNSQDADIQTTQKILFISGMKQTGYMWQFVGVCELLFGLLLLMQWPSFIAAVFLLPITINIFFFHLFLEPEHIGELVYTGSLLLANILLVTRYKNDLKHLFWKRPTLME